jgi:putative ATPase
VVRDRIFAEEAIYTDKLDPMVNWDTDELRVAFEDVGLGVEVDEIRVVKELFTRSSLHQTVNWESAIAFVRAELPSR